MWCRDPGYHVRTRDIEEKAAKMTRTSLSGEKHTYESPRCTIALPTAVKVKLETIRSTLEKKQTIITSLDEEIEDLFDKKEIKKEIIESSEFEFKVEGLICQVKSVLSFTASQNAAEKSPLKHETGKGFHRLRFNDLAAKL